MRNEKKVLRKERRMQENRPIVHIRNVHTGSDVSSSFNTVRRTSSMGDKSSSVSSRLVLGAASISRVVVVVVAAMGRRVSDSGEVWFEW